MKGFFQRFLIDKIHTKVKFAEIFAYYYLYG